MGKKTEQETTTTTINKNPDHMWREKELRKSAGTGSLKTELGAWHGGEHL
jgi:hypothetical protein